MTFEIVAAICAGIFAGAALYITFVEHPARIECGTELALEEFGPSYRRAAIMQASLAIGGLVGGVAAWLQGRGAETLVAALLLGAVVPFTLIVIYPTNKRLLDPRLDPRSAEAEQLHRRWGHLHAVRSAAGALAFGLLVWHLATG